MDRWWWCCICSVNVGVDNAGVIGVNCICSVNVGVGGGNRCEL